MDPNATLARIRELTAIVEAEEGDVGPYMTAELAELVTALDEWPSRGGFLPRDWRME